MILTHTKGHINTYKLGDQEIKYNTKTKIARFINGNGSETKNRNSQDMSEHIFVQNCFDKIKQNKKVYTLLYMIEQFQKSREGKIAIRTAIEDKGLFSIAGKLFANIDFSDTTSKQIRDILGTTDFSIDKTNRIKKKMQQVVDFAIAEDLYPCNYNIFKSIKLKSVPKSEKKAKLFFEASADVPTQHHTISRLASVAKSPQQKMMLLLCTITGARINEIMSLTWEDLKTIKGVTVLRIRNSKVKPTDTNMDEYRYMDINPTHLQTIYQLKSAIQKLSNTKRATHGGFTSYTMNTKRPLTNRHCDRNPSKQWQYILTGADGYSPSYTTLRSWYANIWALAHDKYKDHSEYPFPYERKPTGLTFHAFRRHYVCSFRDSIENFSLSDHVKLQQMIGHTVGSRVTDDIYTQFDATKVPYAELNSQINLGVKF